MASVLGLELAVTLHPAGDPVRDKSHLALLARFRKRLHPSIRWRTEVPIPIEGDRRAADAVIGSSIWAAMVEAETQIDDVQALDRKISLKQRDLGLRRVILVVADTRAQPLRRRECPRSGGPVSSLDAGLSRGVELRPGSWRRRPRDPVEIVGVRPGLPEL